MWSRGREECCPKGCSTHARPGAQLHGNPALGRETNWKWGQLALFKHFYTHLYLEESR